MLRRHLRSTRTDTRFPCPTLFRSREQEEAKIDQGREIERLRSESEAQVAEYNSESRRRAELARIAQEREVRMRSEEHTSELQSLMRIPYSVFCLKKNKQQTKQTQHCTVTRQQYTPVQLTQHH